MVSIRRRKLLSKCSGRNSFLTPLPKFSDYGKIVEHRQYQTTSIHHPVPSIDVNKQTEKISPESSNLLNSNLLNELQPHHFPEVKRRKRHRRKPSAHHEQCVMRGVYYKNMKWQAAIKVDKKQIHLGTVGSQEEAARLYDRAAFMCGREPNFELSDEAKQELRKFKWEDFLLMTRTAISSKKQRRKPDSGPRGKSEPLDDISASDDLEPEASGC